MVKKIRRTAEQKIYRKILMRISPRFLLVLAYFVIFSVFLIHIVVFILLIVFLFTVKDETEFLIENSIFRLLAMRQKPKCPSYIPALFRANRLLEQVCEMILTKFSCADLLIGLFQSNLKANLWKLQNEGPPFIFADMI